MYTVIPILIGVLISIARFVLWKQDTKLDKHISAFFEKCSKRTVLILSFWPAAQVCISGIVVVLFTEISLGIALNSLIFCSIVLVEVLAAIVGYNARNVSRAKQ